MRREEQHSNQINHALYHLNSLNAYSRRMIAFRDKQNANALTTAYSQNPIKFMSVFDDKKESTPFIYSVKSGFTLLHDGLLFYSPLMKRQKDQTAARAYSYQFLMSGLVGMDPVSVIVFKLNFFVCFFLSTPECFCCFFYVVCFIVWM